MTEASGDIAARRVGEGWVELAQGRWERARALFDEALAEDETGEALEGLSWAVWWLDDAAAVFDARERAYRLYKKTGQAASAARMAAWIAADELDFHGAAAVAAGWLQRAHRLLEQLEPSPEHGWLAFFEGYVAILSGEAADAAELAVRAAELGRRLAVPDLEMLGLALEGATLVAQARVEEGMRRLDEATVTALEGEATIPISGAWACCFLVSACAAVRDYERAFEWCDRIAEFAERYGSRYMLAFCRAEYGAVHLWRGRWQEAEALLEASIEDFSRSRPAMVGGALVELAELRRRQGRREEAALLLDEAGASGSAQIVRARLAVDANELETAVELAERFLRQAGEANRLACAPALEVLVRARVSQGDVEAATEAVAALRGLEAQVGTVPLRAAADLAEGRAAAAGGNQDRARPLLEDAVDRFERSGGRFEAAEAGIELAACLLALGRIDAARQAARTAFERLRELGATVEADRARRLLDGFGAPEDSPALAALTPRERDVLGLLAEGLTNRQIAARLFVSEHTVHRHVTNILRKLDLPSRTAAATHAVRSDLLERQSR